MAGHSWIYVPIQLVFLLFFFLILQLQKLQNENYYFSARIEILLWIWNKYGNMLKKEWMCVSALFVLLEGISLIFLLLLLSSKRIYFLTATYNRSYLWKFHFCCLYLSILFLFLIFNCSCWRLCLLPFSHRSI